jgi:hypothetical protein
VAVGLTLGLVDLREGSRDTAAVALKDTVYGGALGTVVGAIIGGLVAIGNGQAERVGLGAAIGTLAGVGTGLTIGVIRGHVAAKRAARRRPGAETTTEPKDDAGPGAGGSEREQKLEVKPTVTTQTDAQGRRVWMLGASGRF